MLQKPPLVISPQAKKMVLALFCTQYLLQYVCKCVAKTFFATVSMINEEYALFSYSNICCYGLDSWLFSLSVLFSFSNPKSINYSILCTPNSVSFKMTTISKLGIFKIRIETRISFIVDIAIWFFLEGSCSSVRRN